MRVLVSDLTLNSHERPTRVQSAHFRVGYRTEPYRTPFISMETRWNGYATVSFRVRWLIIRKIESMCIRRPRISGRQVVSVDCVGLFCGTENRFDWEALFYVRPRHSKLVQYGLKRRSLCV
ncbi:hypothetical protein WH47_11762 [Habropoda laboriosa]|uniref:Uncharacterized protein n=1 Tax=Habropoda laboriosa TaxID=597456 RepID=A0A0L7R8D9_9HYME|nr:hypothetical protein WH47_11762 [Habropoda laboriosa]